MLKNNVGYIKLHGNFAGNTDEELRKAHGRAEVQGPEGAGLRPARQPGRPARSGDQGRRRVRRHGHHRHHRRLRQQAARGEARARRARSRTCRWRCSSTTARPRRRRSSPARSRTSIARSIIGHAHLRQGLGAGALRQRRRLGAQADHRAVPDAGRRLDPVGRHHARRRARQGRSSTRTRASGCSASYKGMQRGRPRRAPAVEVRARAATSRSRPSSTWRSSRRRRAPRRRCATIAPDATTTTGRRIDPDEEEDENPTDPDALVEDYEIDFARDLVSQAKGWKRREVLASSKPLLRQEARRGAGAHRRGAEEAGRRLDAGRAAAPAPTLVGTVVDRQAAERGGGGRHHQVHGQDHQQGSGHGRPGARDA